jgi:phosphodiesterase/alkaline phosphatase D-like protein
MIRQIYVVSLAVLLGLFTLASWAQGKSEQSPRVTKGPNVQDVGPDHAQIAWSTNVNSGQIVRYGTDPNHLDQMKESKWGGEREKNGDYLHKLELTSLKPGTKYYFDVESTKAAGNRQNLTGKVESFQTQGSSAAAAKTAPNASKNEAVRITNGPLVKNTSDTATEIAWSTDVQGSSIVKYGSSPTALTQTAEAPWGGTREPNGDYNHSVSVRNLKPNTTYYFVVATTQGAGTGTQAQSQPQEFHTASIKAKK